MTRTHALIETLLKGYTDQYAIPEDAQEVLARVRQRLVSSQDLRADLGQLYDVTGCDQLALGLMWVVDRSTAEPGRTTPTPEEIETVHGGLTGTLTALGYLGEESQEQPDDAEQQAPDQVAEAQAEEIVQEQAVGESSPEMPKVVEEPLSGGDETPAPPAEEPAMEEVMSPPAEPDVDSAFTAEQPVAADGDPPPAPPEGGTTDTAEIGQLLERFLDALQSGSDERDQLLGSLRASFAACLASDATDASLRNYSEVVSDFLGYIQENQLLDDVRVMNFFTNVQEPYDQWINAPEGEREGLLEQAIEFLTDFRAMFE